jgi:type IV secretion system protein VirB10
MVSEPNGPTSASNPVRDRRDPPRGVLPRQVQVWVMAGLAVVIVVIILMAGHTQPPEPPSATARIPTALLPDADRIRAYQQQLADDEARLKQMQTEAARMTTTSTAGASPHAGTRDVAANDAQRREEQRLFADNVAFSRRPNGQSAVPAATTISGAGTGASLSPDAQALVRALAAFTPRAAAPPTAAEAPTPATPPASSGRDATTPVETPSPGPRQHLLEGTVIETVLINRLDSTFAGPVECLVTTPVYAHDRQAVLIPAGARVLGTAAPVQAWGESKLAVSFHRLVMPDGHTYSLDRFVGLDGIGETGLTDEVNRHYWQVFGASLAVGALAGLAQYNTRGIDAATFGDTYRQATGASLASSGTRILDRFLNVLPTITIREGFRIKVYLTNDLELPAYAAGVGGGVR